MHSSRLILKIFHFFLSFLFVYFLVQYSFSILFRISAEEDKASPGDQDRK